MKRELYYLCIFITILAAAGCAKKDTDNKDATRKSIALKTFQIFDSGSVNELDGIVSENAVDHQTDTSISKKTGLAGVKDMFTMFHSIFPDMKTTVHSIAVSGDTLFAYTSSTGTPVKPFMGMPANVKVNMSGVDIFRFEGDKIVEHWGFLDAGEMMNMMKEPMKMNDSSKMKNKMNDGAKMKSKMNDSQKMKNKM